MTKPTGLSLWLVPEGEARERLSTLITRLAHRVGSPTFDPHVTLLGGITMAETEARSRCQELVAELRPLTLRLGRPDHGPQYFRCLFLEIEPSPELSPARARARALLGGGEEAFRPHLSLVYGTLALGEKERMVAEVSKESGTSFVVRHLDLHPTNGAVEEWRPVARFPLG